MTVIILISHFLSHKVLLAYVRYVVRKESTRSTVLSDKSKGCLLPDYSTEIIMIPPYKLKKI